jgi:hypothetical protein
MQHLEDLRSRADAQHAERSRALTSHHEARVSELEQRLAQQQEQLETQRQQLESIYAGGEHEDTGMSELTWPLSISLCCPPSHLIHQLCSGVAKGSGSQAGGCPHACLQVVAGDCQS